VGHCFIFFVAAPENQKESEGACEEHFCHVLHKSCLYLNGLLPKPKPLLSNLLKRFCSQTVANPAE
jgi:hypothetical protein